MHKEVSKAVEVFHKIAFKNYDTKKLMTEVQLRMFISIFTELLLKRYEKFWFPDEPDRASGYRCIRVNAQCFDPLVALSLKQAGVPTSKHKKLVCGEVTVWVDPGVVSMRIGEDGSVGHEIVDEELYARNMAARGGSPKPKVKEVVDSDVDEGFGSRSPSPPDTPTNSDLSSSRSHKEYNPYAMSAKVVNARGSNIFARNHVRPQRHTTSPPSSVFNSSPANRNMSRPMMPQGPPPTAPNSVYNGHIPVSGASFPSARRSVFAEHNGMPGQLDNYGQAMTANNYHMALNYQTSQPSHNYLDIPVVA